MPLLHFAPGSGEPTKRAQISKCLSQENVIANLKMENYLVDSVAALGAGIGINAEQSGAITSALKSGNYAAALTSLVDFSGSNAAIGGLSGALQSVDNGDIVGAFHHYLHLGIDSKLMVLVVL